MVEMDRDNNTERSTGEGNESDGAQRETQKGNKQEREREFLEYIETEKDIILLSASLTSHANSALSI